jgi:site-specific DNA-methyltransferase (adenine-specific)
LIFTSPPYFCVKNYGNVKGNIGNISNYNEYIDSMKQVFSECYRVLKNGRFIIVNISVVRDNGEIYNIPSDFYYILSQLNFKPQDIIIWEKPNQKRMEDMRFGSVVQTQRVRLYYPNNCYEYLLVFYKGEEPTYGENFEDGFVNYLIANGFNRDVWHIPSENTLSDYHSAPFPLLLCDLVVKIYSNPNETVLDPFIGSGTLALSCINNNRNCIGYEINPDYIKVIKKRLNYGQTYLGSKKVEIEILKGVSDSDNILTFRKCTGCGKENIAYVYKDYVYEQCENCNLKVQYVKALWGDYNYVKFE